MCVGGVLGGGALNDATPGYNRASVRGSILRTPVITPRPSTKLPAPVSPPRREPCNSLKASKNPLLLYKLQAICPRKWGFQAVEGVKTSSDKNIILHYQLRLDPGFVISNRDARYAARLASLFTEGFHMSCRIWGYPHDVGVALSGPATFPTGYKLPTINVWTYRG